MPEFFLPLLAFLIAAAVVAAIFLLSGNDKDRLDERLDEMSGKKQQPVRHVNLKDAVGQALPQLAQALAPSGEEYRTRLQARLLHAGFYRPQAVTVFLSVKTVLIFLPWLVGLAVGLTALLPLHWSVAGGAVVGGLGLILPDMWLRKQINKRKAAIREALPDVLDVLVICLEAGASFPAAFQRVTRELKTAHPLLCLELTIVQREMQMGMSTAEALKHFAERSDLDEVQNLATVIGQAERFGGGLVSTMKVYSESLRERRMQQAEENANKAATKILMPTLLFIFPGIFIVLIGPAAIQVMSLFQETQLSTSHSPDVEMRSTGEAKRRHLP